MRVTVVAIFFCFLRSILIVYAISGLHISFLKCHIMRLNKYIKKTIVIVCTLHYGCATHALYCTRCVLQSIYGTQDDVTLKQTLNENRKVLIGMSDWHEIF